MSFINVIKFWLRNIVLAIFIIAMLGTWTFDMINVPAQYLCEKPFVRLYGDFCGMPMSGFDSIRWFTSGFSFTLAELVKGNFAVLFPELIALIWVMVILLPFFSNLLLIRSRTSRRLQTINVIVWAIALLPTFSMFVSQSNRDEFVQFFYLQWGLLLYILLAIGTLIFEIMLLRMNVKSNMAINR